MATLLPRPTEPVETAEDDELDYADPMGVRLGEPFRIEFLHDLKIDTQLGTIWLGFWGVLSAMLFAAGVGVLFLAGMDQVHGSLFLLVKYFANIRETPPDGLGMARSLRDGGYWQLNTLLWAGSTLAWGMALGDPPDRNDLGVPSARRRFMVGRACART
jgi:hypothetical protein